MAVSIVPNPTFTIPVKLTVPGASDKAVLEFTFRHLGRRKLRSWREKAAQHSDNDAAWLSEVIANWGGPLDDQGTPVPFSVERLDELLDAYPSSGMEILQAFIAELSGAREGN